MIVVTGGAGFIGSVIVSLLNRERDDILIVDELGKTEKWKNLRKLSYADYYDKTDFITKLENGFFGNEFSGIIHMGACSSTTEINASYLMENNFSYTKRLALWRKKHSNIPFIYASSAATYGAGENGFSDNEDNLNKLKPLNMYGYSKHIFDLFAKKQGWLEEITGLKYFNVFGPNEYHKGEMRSLVNKAFPVMRDKGYISLFKSYKEEFPDGGQKRDFIYVKDAAEMTLFFLKKEIGGIYNIGTGKARTWNALAEAMFSALKIKKDIRYIDMPLSLRSKYQYFTEADTSKLYKIGCTHKCMSLENAVNDYINNYLVREDRFI